MDIWKSLLGMVELELTSADPEAALGAIADAGIPLRKLTKRNDLTCGFLISRSQWKQLEVLCRRRGETLKVTGRPGLYWKLQRLKQRWLLLAGCFFLVTMVFWLPTRVLFISVEGNQRIPSRKILAAAEGCGISFGANRREVRSEQVKNALLSAVPELQWAGVNTSGCTATISVREKAPEAQEASKPQVASIVAAQDGFLLEVTVTRGNPLVSPGQSVQRGQVLISGYTDVGLAIRAEQAEGEVFAQTSRALEAVTPAQCLQKGQTQGIRRKITLLLGKKRINLWKDSGIWDGTCGRMYEEYYITLPGGFQLPLALCVESYSVCEVYPVELAEEAAKDALRSFSEGYLRRQMVAGQIVSGNETVSLDGGCFRLQGDYVCREMIGKLRQEQIGESNGKNN